MNLCGHKSVFKTILMIISGLVLGIIMAFIFGLFTMLLWNWLMPIIFNLPKITYWQAWGIVLLSHILFKSHPDPHHEHPKKMIKAHIKKKIEEKIDSSTTDSDE